MEHHFYDLEMEMRYRSGEINKQIEAGSWKRSAAGTDLPLLLRMLMKLLPL
ncbi:hypothetical protein [Paenibacillus turpanensis]|uniref:hypothetical protein n=1 Tax=Paenibacillus turpanensis TaxID=2689078 RepID=UPI0014075471|nr:hypothetical protein [Paenibacillus turpanensis]